MKEGVILEDARIIDLYWARSESAIAETDRRYGKYCFSIASNILDSREDAEESVNDTYLAAWNAMPPERPSVLSAFLGRITRNLSIDRWRARSRLKRGGGEVPLALEELQECIADHETPEKSLERKRLALVINQFLDTLPQTERRIFLCRYWYLDPVSTIAGRCGFSESKVASMLYRTRKKLRTALEKEGLL